MASKKIASLLSKEPGITNTEIDFEEGKEQIVIRINDKEAQRLGLKTSQIALEMRRFLSGDDVTTIREFDEDINIRIFLEDDLRSNPESLMNLHIKNRVGQKIPLSKVATLERKPAAFVIRRLKQKRVISVQASIDKKQTTSLKVAQTFHPKVDNVLKEFPNLNVIFGGENKDTRDSMLRLARSGIIAFSCIFLILVIMFNNLLHPFVVVGAIPLGLVGVIWTFFLMGQSLGFMALLGVVALIGVVVNDSIILVNFINKTRKRDSTQTLIDSVREASLSRFRPVILTTFTTVAGLLPLAHPTVARTLSLGRAIDTDPFIQPMALSFAWGLFFASVVTLIFIPCSYLVFEQVKNYTLSLWKSVENLAR